MSDYDYETVLTFRKSKYFWKFLNRQMLIYDMDSLNDYKYKLLFFSSIPEDFNTAINENTGCLKSVTGLTEITTGFTNQTFDLGVRWLDNGENGFSLYLNSSEDIEIPINSGVTLNIIGVALAKVTGTMSGSKYIVAYARLPTSMKCQNSITLQSYSEFVGHSSCTEV